MKNLRSKVAVVTGAGSGIGKALSIELAKEGCHLAICDISREGLEETRKELQPLGINVSTHMVDVSDENQVNELSEAVIEAHGHVHLLVNNAGIASGVVFSDQSIEDFRRVMDVNLYGVIYGCKSFLPMLKNENEAHIVNTCSIAGLIGYPILNAYATSKFAVRGFSESLWLELKDHNIHVTIVFPGYTDTKLIETMNIDTNVHKLSSFQKFSQKYQEGGNSPSRVARRIISGIKRNKLEVIVGPDTILMEMLKRYFPKLAFLVADKAYHS